MDLRYLAFCHPGNPFYDTGGADADAPAEPELAADTAPEGWKRDSDAEWTHLSPVTAQMPLQGWKIHVSATIDNAERILAVVLDYCLPRTISFKFLRNLTVLGRRNSKYGDRSGSGKFVTIYPSDEQQLALILSELGDLLDGEHGPYILSDLRWRSGPLYVRYGGFVSRLVRTESGELVHCIEDPDGNLVPDRRGPGFRPPEWVTIPACLQEAWAARQAGTLEGFPFRVTAALHFSNGGGVYRAVDNRTGAEVLLKEARPYAGVDELGRDAVQRQETERWALEQLAGMSAIPAMIEHRLGHEHYFLARGFAPGKPLQRIVSARNPFVNGETDPEALASYTEWALGILDQVAESLRQMHERGVVYGDLHPGNILVDDGGAVAFIDLETASAVEDHAGQAIGAPGFRAPSHYRGVEVDVYALACTRLSIFVPLTVIMQMDRSKLEELLRLVAATFPVPAGFAEQVRRELGPSPYGVVEADRPRPAAQLWPEPTPQSWPELRERLAGSILAAATPERDDRLYPGDIGQFLLPAGGISLAYGAAGVLCALADLGIEVPDAHVSWLTAAVRRTGYPAPGLFDGLAGVAYALDRLGRPEQCHEVLAAVRAVPLDQVDDTLMSGQSGIVAAYAHLANRSGDTDLAEACLAVVDRLRAQPLAQRGGDQAGLLRGAAGRAVAYLHAHRLTGDDSLLAAAAEALRHDLGKLGWTPDEAETPAAQRRVAGWLLPVLQAGGGGIALVAGQLLRHHDAPDLAAFRDAITPMLEQEYFALSGLFQGRAGAMLTLHQQDRPAQDPVLRRHLRALGWTTLPFGDSGLAFLGDGLLRMSFDLATGSAGVLAVVDRIVTGRTGALPLYLLGDERAGDPGLSS